LIMIGDYAAGTGIGYTQVAENSTVYTW
jgi:hypothetical protein